MEAEELLKEKEISKASSILELAEKYKGITKGLPEQFKKMSSGATGYNDKLKTLLETLRRYLNSRVADNFLLNYYLYIPVITRLSIEIGINAKTEKEVKEAYALYKVSITLLELTLKGEYKKAVKIIDKLKDTDFYKKHQDDLIEEPEDPISAYWSAPRAVIKLTDHVAQRFKHNKKLILLNFAHGSTRVASLMLIELKIRGFKVEHVPVRFSAHKAGDKELKFPNPKMKDRVRKLLKKGYELIILDEDVSSGKTFELAMPLLLTDYSDFKEQLHRAVIMEARNTETINKQIVDFSGFKIYEFLDLIKKGFIDFKTVLVSLTPNEAKRMRNQELINSQVNFENLKRILKSNEQVLMFYEKLRADKDSWKEWLSRKLSDVEIKELINSNL